MYSGFPDVFILTGQEVCKGTYDDDYSPSQASIYIVQLARSIN